MFEFGYFVIGIVVCVVGWYVNLLVVVFLVCDVFNLYICQLFELIDVVCGLCFGQVVELGVIVVVVSGGSGGQSCMFDVGLWA